MKILHLKMKRRHPTGPMYFVFCRLYPFYPNPLVISTLKGIVQPLGLGAVTRLIQSAIKIKGAGKFSKKKFMIQSHEMSIKPFSAA
jgi:hypothetical protein